MKKVYVIPIFAMLVVAILVSIIGLTHDRKSNTVDNTEPQMQILPRLAISFIENEGQWGTPVEFMVRKPGMTAWLLKDRVTFQFEKREERDKAKGIVMSIAFEGASEQVVLSGEQEQTANYNFFIGNDCSKWQSNVAGYAKVMYHRLYEGIDLCFREDNGWLEYDLLLSRSADLSDVVIRCEGLKKLRIDENGILVMETEFGLITQPPPKAWYKLASGEKMPVECTYRKIDSQRYGFEVPERDVALALVIDPGLEWSTFLGGSQVESVMRMALNTSGDIVVAGYTESVNFPTTGGAYDTTFNGGTNDGFVSCLSSDGSQLLWSTFLGGSDVDVLLDLNVDDTDSITVSGLTLSSDFPTTPGAFDTSYNGSYDAIVARLSEDGNQLVYSTYLGGIGQEWALALDVDDTGNAVVGGYTNYSDFPTTPGSYDTTHNGGRDAFITRLSADGTSLIWSTYLGGMSNEGGWTYTDAYPIVENLDELALVVDQTGDVIVSGNTISSDFPTTSGAYDTTINGSFDVFLTRLNTSGTDLVYSTFLGGSGYDRPFVNGIIIEPSNAVIVSGCTRSNDFPVTPGAFDTTRTGMADGFIARLDSTGSNLLYSTYIGGTSNSYWDAVADITLDMAGNVIATGFCAEGFPITFGAYDTIYDGYRDGFVSRLNLGGNGQADLLYSTYVGGVDADVANSIFLLADSTVIIAGGTYSWNFPTYGPVFDSTFNGMRDGFILRFGAYVGIQEQTMTKPQSSITLSPVYPNPARGRFSYEISLPRPKRVKVSLVDITGRLVETLIDKQLSAGAHNFTWIPKSELANGVYYLCLDADGEQQSRKFIMMK